MGDVELDFQILGFPIDHEEFTKTSHMKIKSDQLHVTGLVLSKQLIQWLEQTPTVEKGQTVCLYQRGKVDEQPVFNYMSALYGGYLSSFADSSHEEKLEKVFPEYAVMPRMAAMDNFDYLNEVTQNGKQATALEISRNYLNSEDEGKLVMTPGTVEYNGINFMCEYIEYKVTDADISEEGEEYNINVKVGLTQVKQTPPPSSFKPMSISATFDAWTEEKINHSYFLPGKDNVNGKKD